MLVLDLIRSISCPGQTVLVQPISPCGWVIPANERQRMILLPQWAVSSSNFQSKLDHIATPKDKYQTYLASDGKILAYCPHTAKPKKLSTGSRSSSGSKKSTEEFLSRLSLGRPPGLLFATPSFQPLAIPCQLPVPSGPAGGKNPPCQTSPVPFPAHYQLLQ